MRGSITLTALFYVLIVIWICTICIGVYHHFYWKKKIEPQFIKGIYTVNLQEVIEQIREDMAIKIQRGENIPEDYVKKRIEEVEKAIEKLAENLPPGYILVLDNVVLGGKNVKRIDLLTGKIEIKEPSLAP